MLIRVDDASKESHFHIRAMVLRPEWDRNQMLEEAEASAMISRHLDLARVKEQPQQACAIPMDSGKARGTGLRRGALEASVRRGAGIATGAGRKRANPFAGS